MSDSIRERLLSLDRRELVGVFAMSALVLAGAVLWYARSLPRPVEIESLGTATQDARATGQAHPSPSPSMIVVDVAGWVRRPGVYEFRSGDRVVDAIRRAGGARKGAHLASLNLAALLADAQQVFVAKKALSHGGGAGVAGDGGSAAGGTPTGTDQGKLDLNTATFEQLEELPGIGEVLAQRILDYREEHGSFASVEDLLAVSGIGDARLADLRSKVTV